MTSATGSQCPCGQAQDPQVISNPPGLAQISYRVNDFTGFRRALLRSLPGEQSIGAWRPKAGDLGLQVLEWWAYLGDVLTFYNERIANESYLRTAKQPGSLANLVALLGYQPAPATAATGYVAALRKPGNTGEPLVIPLGMPLSSVATPGVASQTFEVAAAASFTGPSSVPVALPPDTTLQLTDSAPSGVLLAGPVSGLKVGDQLVLAEGNFAGQDDNWSLVTVTAVTATPDPNTGVVNTQVEFSSPGWGPPSSLTTTPVTPPAPPTWRRYTGLLVDPEISDVYFGNDVARQYLSRRGWAVDDAFDTAASTQQSSAASSPSTAASSAGPSTDATTYRLLRPTATAALFNGDADQPAVVPNPNSTSPLAVHLSAAVRGISPGDLVLFDGLTFSPPSPPAPTALAFAMVTGTSETLYTVPYPVPAGGSPPNPPDIVLAHTVLNLTLVTADSNALQNTTDTSTVTVRYGFKDVGTIIGQPATVFPALPATVGVPEAYTPPSGGTTAMLQDANGNGVLVTVSSAGSGQVTVAGAGAPLSTIPASPALAPPFELLLDLLAVSRGTTVSGEVLGSGNAAFANQSFTLSKSPLTYLASGNGAVSTLAVYVDRVEWQEVPSFFGQPANARVFVVSRSPDQSVTTVTFGDGINGARLTSGIGNVTGNYRYGAGAASPPAGRLTMISQPQPGLASISNPVPVSPGADAQPADSVRTNAPASVFTFGRAISADDYAIVASEAPGVNRATAVWTFDDATQRTIVTIYVGDDTAAVTSASAALAGADDPNRPVSVVAANPIDLQLSCTLLVAADRQIAAVVAAATAAICDPMVGLFSPASMGVGQRLYRSAVDAALMVPGVVAVRNLVVTQPAIRSSYLRTPYLRIYLPVYRPVLNDVFDSGEGSFFRLLSENVTIAGVNSGG